MPFTVAFEVATQDDAVRAAHDLLRVQPLIAAVTVTTPEGRMLRVMRDGDGFRAEPVVRPH